MVEEERDKGTKLYCQVRRLLSFIGGEGTRHCRFEKD